MKFPKVYSWTVVEFSRMNCAPYVLIVKDNKNILYAENLYYDKINNRIYPSKNGKRVRNLGEYSVAEFNTEKGTQSHLRYSFQ